jgi:hypothetical protein
MKYINLFLVFSIILCYTGLGEGLSLAQTRPNKPSCHAKVLDGTSHTEPAVNSPQNGNPSKSRCVCFEALTSAAYNHDVDQKNIILSSAIVNTQLEFNKVSDYRLNLDLKRNNQPLELYLVNSSFLL